MTARLSVLRRPTLCLSLYFSLNLLLSACGTPNATVPAQPGPSSGTASAAGAPAAADYRPALWSVEHEGRRSWLFGALPWADAGVQELPAALRQALQDSELLASELRQPVPPLEAAALLAGLRKPQASFRAGLEPELGAAYEQLCSRQQLPCQALDSLPPFFVVASLHKLLAQKAGLQSNEQSSMQRVHRAMRDKEFLELEGLQAGFRLLQSIPEEDQRALLRRLLQQEGQDSLRSYAAWRRGDVAALQADVEASAFSPATRARIQGQRERQWSETLARSLRQCRRVFVAVAPGHLGPDGLPALLRAQGFQVERVHY